MLFIFHVSWLKSYIKIFFYCLLYYCFNFTINLFIQFFHKALEVHFLLLKGKVCNPPPPPLLFPNHIIYLDSVSFSISLLKVILNIHKKPSSRKGTKVQVRPVKWFKKEHKYGMSLDRRNCEVRRWNLDKSFRLETSFNVRKRKWLDTNSPIQVFAI